MRVASHSDDATRLIGAFMAAARASAGTFWRRDGDDFVMAASTDEARHSDVDGMRVSASALASWEPRWVDNTLILPLRAGETVLGIVRLEGADSSATTFEAVCALADFTARGLAGTAGFETVDYSRESETGCYPLAFFLPHVEKEVAKARRYHRQVALAYAVLDRYEELVASAEPHLVRGAATRLLRALEAITREADVITRPRDGEFAVLLPETDTIGGYAFARRVMNLFLRGEAASKLVHLLPLSISIGVSSFPHDAESANALLLRSRERAHQREVSLIRRFGLEFQSLWDLVATLLRDADHYAVSRSGRLFLHKSLTPFDDPDGTTRHGFFPDSLFDCILREVGHDIARRAPGRGFLLLLETTPRQEVAMEAFSPLAGSQTRITYLAGQQVRLASAPYVVVVPIDRSLLPETRLAVYFGPDTALSVVTRASDERGSFGFHSTDPLLAELLVARIHETYRGAKVA